MNDTLFKTAISAVLLGMDQEELDNLHPELFIVHHENWPTTLLENSTDMFTIKEQLQLQLRKRIWPIVGNSNDKHFFNTLCGEQWKQFMMETLDALWALHDDPSEKTKVFLEWIGKQQ
jgi:hypothetical protein